jgi:hypothetical protein
MNAREQLSIDLANPDDIRDKLPLARDLYRAKARELENLTEQVESWKALVDLLARLVGEPGIEPLGAQRGTRSGRKRAPGQERAVEALERAGQPMGPSLLYRFMVREGMEAPANRNALGANLWAAEKAGRVKKIDGGQYAPLDWQPDQGLLNSTNDGANGAEGAEDET